MPLKILVGANVSPDPNAGASGTVWQMNAALRRRGHQVDEIWAENLGRRIQHGNLHYLLELPRTYVREVRKACQQQTYDVIELNQPHAYLASRDHKNQQRSGVFVNRSHGHETRSEEQLQPWRNKLGVSANRGLRRLLSRAIGRLLDRQWQSIAKSADGIVVSCSDDAEFLNTRYGVPKDRVGCITQGVPQIFLDQPVAAMTSERLHRVIYIGQLAFFKAPQVIAESINLILRRNTNATMTWVCGRPHHQQAMQMLNEDIRNRVSFVDWMDQTQLQQHLDTHGTFLFPSYFEGFGKAPLEAMARGLCVTATDVGGMKDYIKDGVSGRLAPPGRADLIANAALQVMNDERYGIKISKAARATAEEHTWDRCAADVEAFYRHLLTAKLKTGP
ncbi:glycosyltransferase family 4 protein [Novipirellula maiorica]|nr:glycosyltransferase family 4 protein [Rhodopirellula maiorica]